MKITVTPTNEQIAAALASVWGCSPEDVGTDGLSGTVEIETDVKGVNKAERTISKAMKEVGQ